MKFLYLMDPLETVNIKKDTTFALMESAVARGHEVYYLAKGGIVLDQGRVRFNVVPVRPQRRAEQPFVCGEPFSMAESDADAVFIRPDPPFDEEYLLNTWLLEQVSPRTVVLNRPAGIRAANEKIWATQFVDLIPRTVITRHKQDYLDFLQVEGKVIVKPTNGHGGTSVFLVDAQDMNANVIFETLSARGRYELVIQQYLPAASSGDKRILLLNGELLGSVLRVHSDDDHRNNFFAGGHAVAADVSPREHEIIARLAPHLRRLGLWFVGIDTIGDHLIEVNVTSPTGIQEAGEFAGERLSDKVNAFSERMVEERQESD